ncbi:MAG: TRAP transporter large permease [Clostridia bacterium]|nr:TRAP transporter large permease [Clostridia bacterium]
MINFGIAIAVLIILICVGVPVAYSMGLSSVFYILIVNPRYLEILPNRSISGINSFLLLAIPFFVLAGEIMTKTDLSRKLFNFARLFVGRFRGGLAFVNIIASTIFGSCSGSAIADVSGLGVIEIEEMTREGYDRDFSIAISAGSSLQAPLIPPSTTVMVYAGVMNVSAGALLMGGVGPGLMIALAQILYVLLIRNKRNFPRDDKKYTKGEIRKTVADGLVTMIMPVIIIGGILGGLVTATEAAAIAVAYCLFLGFVYYRNMTWKSLKECLWNTCKTVGNLMLIVAFANAFSWVAAIEKVPDEIAAMLMSISSNKYVLLMIVNVFYIFVGMIMDTGAAIILFAPIIGPVLTTCGVNPIHLAMVTIMNLTIGLLTPPVGLVLYTAVNVGKRPFEKVVKAFMPFIYISYGALILVTFFPAIVTWLPRLAGFRF